MTKLHVHELAGLKPDALATYLAALGVMRLLAEQKDANVRGFWRNEHFVLVSELNWEAIERFFLEKEGFAPTPILAPWNMESGFFSLKPTDASTDEAHEALDASEASDGNENADGVLLDDDDKPKRKATRRIKQSAIRFSLASRALRRSGSHRFGVQSRPRWRLSPVSCAARRRLHAALTTR